MNPKSEKIVPAAEGGLKTPEAGTRVIPEGFYNPETERVPVPRTEAARTLTKLVAILAPDQIATENIDMKHQIDGVGSAYQESLVPTRGRIKDEFNEIINPRLLFLEKIGFGDCRTFSYEKNFENFTITEDEKIQFDGLYTPWQYGPDGEVTPAVDVEELRKAVSELPEETELEKQTKQQAEIYVDMVETSIQEEMSKPVVTLIERLDEPNFEHLETLRNTLGLISDEMIEQVATITTIEAFDNSANRSLMKNLTAPLMTLMKSMYKNSKIGADNDHTKYPEFWQLVDRYHKINCAMGTKIVSKNLVLHEVAYPKLYV